MRLDSRSFPGRQSFLGRLRRGVGGWLGRTAAVLGFSLSSSARPIDTVIAEMLSGAGRVTRAEALSVPTVLRGRNLICSIATLPLRLYGPDRSVLPSSLLAQLDPDVPNLVTIAQTVEDLVFEGISWWKITAQDFAGYPLAVRHLDVGTVSLTPPASLTTTPLPSGIDPHGARVVWVNGDPVPVTQIIRFDSPNPGLLTAAGRPIRRALLLDQAASMYADDPRPLDYFTPADDAEDLDDEEAAAFLARWRSSRKRRSTAWLPRSVKYNAVESPSPRELQLVELQQRAALDIANALGVDPEDLGISTTSRTYFNAVDRRQSRINDMLAVYMLAVTGRLSMGDVTRRGQAVEFDLTGYLKADPATRTAYYRDLIDLGVIDTEEARTMEGLGPRPSGSTAAAAPAAAGGAGAGAAANSNVLPIRRAFNGQPHRLTFEVSRIGFTVDTSKRTIAGLAVPYNKVAEKFGVKYRFKPNSLQWTDVSHVKHYIDHVQPIGRALDLKDGRAGLAAKMSVASGQKGDELLTLAQEGVYDGMSVGVDFSLDPEDGDVVLNKDGVYDVVRADLREISTTPMPAFTDARVTTVVASLTGGKIMPCANCGQVHAEGVTCPALNMPAVVEPTPAAPNNPPSWAGATFSMDQVQALLALAGQQAGIAPAGAPAAPEEPRPVVDATRPTGNVFVAEPAPYVLDRKGNIRRGTHEFSSDIIAGLRDGDRAAYERALRFVQATFDATDTTDTAGLNPNRQRPDLYVDQRSFRYPMWEAINKGTLADVTPFVFPKFNSASGMVAAHTQGTEPSIADFTVTTQTVTPSAISGKAEINREVWDQGGNPQVSTLIWNQMLKGWYEALEAAAVAVLDAASPTQIDFSGSPGLADSDLDQALTAAFADLQFVRGGFSMDNMFAQIDFYKALIAAMGADGRRLYPALGPTNASGTVSNRFGSIDVNGVTAYPAWALAATGTVAASSYLFDSDSVHGWASAPQRLTFDTQVKSVFLGIWGYKATAVSDINGVREIVYDPS